MLHADIRREFASRLAGIVAGTEQLPTKLRSYQSESIASLVHHLNDPEGPRQGHFSHATGLGKTILFAAMARVCVGLRVLIVVPTKTLVEQTARTVSRFTSAPVGHLSSLDVVRHREGDIAAFRGQQYVDVVVATVASFNRFAPRIAREFDPHIIIHDECHWAYIDATTRSLAFFPEAVILGLSATPDYLGTVVRPGYVPVTLEGGQTLYGAPERFAEAHFGPRLDERNIRWGIENGWLTPLAWGRIEFDVSLDAVPTQQTATGPDYGDMALQRLMALHWLVMLETIRRLYASGEYDLPNRQTFAVCQSVAAAQELARTIHELGVPSACVTGMTPDRDRNRILSAFRNNQIRFLTSVMVLREGWDAPNAEVCLMLRPTKSRVLYQQSMDAYSGPLPMADSRWPWSSTRTSRIRAFHHFLLRCSSVRREQRFRWAE